MALTVCFVQFQHNCSFGLHLALSQLVRGVQTKVIAPLQHAWWQHHACPHFCIHANR